MSHCRRNYDRRPTVRNTILTGSCAFAALVTITTSVHAQQPDYQRTLSLDSRYFLQSYSNSAIGRFGIEVLNLSTVPADLIGSGGTWRNIGRGAVLLVGSTILGQGFGVPFHEYGHGTRAAAVGLRPVYGFGRIRTAQDVEAAYASGDTHDAFFGYYLRYFFKGGSAYALAVDEDTPFTPLSDEEVDALGWSGVGAAGGLNNEMFYAELIEDEMSRHGGHPGYFTSYVNAKLAANQYEVSGVFSDKNNVVEFYRSRGYSISGSDIDDASVRSLAFSSASYQLLWETLRMFAGKPFRYRPWSVYGLQLPNLSFYMTRSGISHRVRSAYSTGNWRIPFAIEHVFEGETRTEISIGGERSSDMWRYSLEATLGRQLGLELEIEYRIGHRFLASAGYVLYDERNLRGERHIPSLEKGARYHGIHVRAAVVY